MRLTSLDIENFRVIKRAILPLPDSVIGVIGPNGAGKSSLVEAIAWALYGNQAARSGRNEIKSQSASAEDSCRVALEFEVDGVPYRVVRSLLGRRERAEVQLYRGEAAESIGVNETRQYVGQLLGLDFRGFLTSFLARQQELNALSDLPPSRRRDHLAGMLGIERLDRGIARLKEDTKLEIGKIDFMERRLAQSAGLAERIAELTERLGRLNARQTVLEQQVSEAETTARESAERFTAAQIKKSEWEQASAQLRANRETRDYLLKQKEKLRDEITALTEASRELAQLDETLEELPAVRAEVEKLAELRSRLELKNQRQQQLRTHEDDLRRIVTAIGNGRDRLSALDDKLAAIPEDIARLLEKVTSDLEQARSLYSDLKAERDSAVKSVEKLQIQIGEIEQFGPESVCDRCHRRLGDDLPQIKKHLLEELASLKQSANDLNRRLEVQGEKGRELKEQQARYDDQARRRYRAEVEKTAAEKELSSLDERRRQVAASIARLNDQLAETAGVEFSADEYERLREKLKRLETDEARRQRLKGTLSRLPAASREAEATAARTAAVDEAIKALNARLSDLDYDPTGFTACRADLEAAQQRLEHARREQASLGRELEITRAELNEKLKQRETRQKEETELEEYRTSRYHHEKLGSLLAEYRRDLIAHIRPRLADLSSRLLTDMTGGKYSFVDLDANYNLQVMDGGEYFGVERFSGGEKDLANLCLRLAISQALTESAGLDRSFVILDEVFGSQDNERKELIVDALGGLKHQFPQILLITHVDDIRDRVEDLIQVRPTGSGYSEVIFNETVVA